MNIVGVQISELGHSINDSGQIAATLELHDSNGTLLTSNDNWRDTQEAEIIATTIPPTNDARIGDCSDVGTGRLHRDC